MASDSSVRLAGSTSRERQDTEEYGGPDVAMITGTSRDNRWTRQSTEPTAAESRTGTTSSPTCFLPL